MTVHHGKSLCPGCFEKKENAPVCPHCGYDENEAPIESVLPPGAQLHHGQYVVGRVLGKPGGFGVTYLGLDARLEIKVAIKEYFPPQCIRKHDRTTVSAPTFEAGEFHAALEGFITEARILAKLKHDSIVRVSNFFEENGTGYLVMDYYEGLTLAEYLQAKGGKLPEPIALAILMPILDGLRVAHQAGIVHRDIKPQNIYLTTGKQPILLDFGAARPIVRKDASLQATIGLHTPGYSPFEQQITNGKQGPWTDVYAGAATLYHMVTGICPPPSGDRILDGDPLVEPVALGVSAKLSAILVKALAVKPEGRYQSIAEFQDALLAIPNAESAQPGKATNKTDTPKDDIQENISQTIDPNEHPGTEGDAQTKPVENPEVHVVPCPACGTGNRIAKNKSLKDAKCDKCGKAMAKGTPRRIFWLLAIGVAVLATGMLNMMGGKKEEVTLVSAPTKTITTQIAPIHENPVLPKISAQNQDTESMQGNFSLPTGSRITH